MGVSFQKSIDQGPRMSELQPRSMELIEPGKDFDHHSYRNAMGGFATGVTIVTTMAGDTPVGVTANSFTSVSLNPPLVLICLGKSLGCVDAFLRTDHFAISVLGHDQEALSTRFATKGIDRFQSTDWQMSKLNNPLIQPALANIECAKHAELDYGDHTIFIGEVLRVQYAMKGDPLHYFGGQYRQLQTG